MGLTSDGRIVTCGRTREFDESDRIESLYNVKDVVSCEGHTAVIYNDGTADCIDERGDLIEKGIPMQSIVQRWSNIKQIAVGYLHIVGLKADGKILAHGFHQIDNIDEWTDVIQIDAFSCYYGSPHTVALRENGTVIGAGVNPVVSTWEGIKQIAVGNHGLVVGLKKDGSVEIDTNFKRQSLIVKKWEDVVCIECKFSEVVGILEDGTIVSTYPH